jgi:uncharacterized OB-fold protein
VTANPFLVPQIEDVAQPFWDGCRAGELRLQRCVDTQRLMFPPRPRSPWGERRVPEWVTVSGRGTIWSFVVPHPPLLEPFAGAAPYNVIVVALEEDPTLRFVGNLVTGPDGEINEIDPATITIGDPVRVVFQRVEDVVLPRWMKT